jgi:dTDP-4-amino-4,6-dideoxygalactose transaminase
LIPFNKPYMTGKELWYIGQAHANRHLSGDGSFTKRCHEWLEQRIGCAKALLTHSCTGALDMAAMLADVKPGDEVIMPSFTFVSTANAFVLRGATPVFVDVRPDTLGLDESKIETAVTARTRVIVPVHYAGVACDMDAIMAIARRHELIVIEDAAHGIMSSCRGRPLGSMGHLAALSFHETKNITCGEGGALLVNDPRFAERAEIIREKGTNRNQFFRGQVDKYTWQDIGSSYLPGELTAAFLSAQMEEADSITARRLAIWERYHAGLASAEREGLLRRPVVPPECRHNAHMYYVLLPEAAKRAHFMAALKGRGIDTVFHYVPLHSAPAGERFGRVSGDCGLTTSISERLVRLPLWVEMTEAMVDEVVAAVIEEARAVQGPSAQPARAESQTKKSRAAG